MSLRTERAGGRRIDHSALEESTVDHRYYDFSTRLRVLDRGDWLDTFERTTRDWLAEKHLRLPEGFPGALASDVAEVLLDKLVLDGAEAVRLTLVEQGDQGEWRTEVLALASRRGGGWISVTVHNSENRFANRPRLVPRLLEGLEVRDGNSELIDDTWIIERPHFREFLDVLGDPARNAPVFVTAARPGADLAKVREWMERRTRELAGLAHTYVLDAEANAGMMHGLGRSMGIRPGSIRSFAPQPRKHDQVDALRHRIIGAGRLDSMPPVAAAALVGRIARYEAANRPEPAELRDARRAFDRKALEDRYLRRRRPLVDSAPATSENVLSPSSPAVPVEVPQTPSDTPISRSPTETAPEVSRPDPGQRTPVPVEEPIPDSSDIPQSVPEERRPDAATPEEAAQSPTELAPLTPDASPRVDELSEEPRAAVPTPETVQPTTEAPALPAAESSPLLDELFAATAATSLADVLDHVRTLERMVDEAAGEARSILEERDHYADQAEALTRTVGGLELELSSELTRRQTAEQNARALTAYRTPGPDAEAGSSTGLIEVIAPDQFSEIPAAVRGLEEFVEFTGDAAATEMLDEFDTVNLAAKKCWDGLLALHDYARATAAGDHSGSLFNYLQLTPDGYQGFAVSNFAAVESESTRGRRDLAEQRRFPVPTNVVSSGTVLMWPHLKLGQIGRVSPRLHFHDDVARSGKVYVGYIGRHLQIAGDR